MRSVVNERVVAPNSSIGQRTDDTAISGKVKATLLVQKVVPVFEILSEDELAQLGRARVVNAAPK